MTSNKKNQICGINIPIFVEKYNLTGRVPFKCSYPDPIYDGIKLVLNVLWIKFDYNIKKIAAILHILYALYWWNQNHLSFV